MKSRHLWIALLFTAAVSASPAVGALPLSHVPDPTLRTLINLGSNAVQIGSLEAPEPGRVGWLCLPAVGIIGGLNRRDAQRVRIGDRGNLWGGIEAGFESMHRPSR